MRFELPFRVARPQRGELKRFLFIR
eukprot:UN23448